MIWNLKFKISDLNQYPIYKVKKYIRASNSDRLAVRCLFRVLAPATRSKGLTSILDFQTEEIVVEHIDLIREAKE